MDTTNIAYLGLGRMGHAMAANLARRSYQVTTWNRTPDRRGAKVAAQAGCRVVPSIQEAVADARYIFLCLADVQDVADVLFGPCGVAESARRGALVIDAGTSGPQAARQFAAKLAALNLRFADAPVTGGDVGAREGTLTIMVGADSADFEDVKPLLQAIGKTVCHCGPVGAGQSLKLVNQVLCAIHMLALCEAITLAEHLGLPASLIMEVCSQGAAGSWALEHLGPKIASMDFSPGFAIKHMRKDLRLVKQALQAGNYHLPGTELADQMFDLAETQSDGRATELATQAMIAAYRPDALAAFAPGVHPRSDS